MLKRRHEVEGVIEKFKQELTNIGIKPVKIILYGSYAKGVPQKHSDIDLIVISDDFEDMNLRERLEILGLVAGRVFEPIEALGYTSKEIEAATKDSFVGEILGSFSIAY